MIEMKINHNQAVKLRFVGLRQMHAFSTIGQANIIINVHTHIHKHPLFGWGKAERPNSTFSRKSTSQVCSEQIISCDHTSSATLAFFRKNIIKEKSLFGFREDCSATSQRGFCYDMRRVPTSPARSILEVQTVNVDVFRKIFPRKYCYHKVVVTEHLKTGC